MKILLACAKIMNDSADQKVPLSTKPQFQAEAEMISRELLQWTAEEMAKNLHCSKAIAEETLHRLRFIADSDNCEPAILAYFGQAYKYLKANDFTDEDFLFAQEHLRMNSFLFGLLRPLDMIHPYRLEGKVKLECNDDKDMFHFWKTRITDVLIDEVKADDGILVHLATKEMEQLFDWKRIKKELHVVQPLFLADAGVNLKTVTVHAKSCRGAMARYIIKNRISDIDELKGFSLDGYEFNERYGDADHPHFIKPMN